MAKAIYHLSSRRDLVVGFSPWREMRITSTWQLHASRQRRQPLCQDHHTECQQVGIATSNAGKDTYITVHHDLPIVLSSANRLQDIDQD